MDRTSPMTEAQTSEPPASPPVTLRASEVPLPEGEDLGERRWFTRTEPLVLVVKAGAKTIERMLERRWRSEAIPRFRARHSGMSEADVDDVEERARQVDGVRRKKRPSKKEVQLRDEASKLRTEAARLLATAHQLIN